MGGREQNPSLARKRVVYLFDPLACAELLARGIWIPQLVLGHERQRGMETSVCRSGRGAGGGHERQRRGLHQSNGGARAGRRVHVRFVPQRTCMGRVV